MIIIIIIIAYLCALRDDGDNWFSNCLLLLFARLPLYASLLAIAYSEYTENIRIDKRTHTLILALKCFWRCRIAYCLFDDCIYVYVEGHWNGCCCCRFWCVTILLYIIYVLVSRINGIALLLILHGKQYSAMFILMHHSHNICFFRQKNELWPCRASTVRLLLYVIVWKIVVIWHMVILRNGRIEATACPVLLPMSTNSNDHLIQNEWVCGRCCLCICQKPFTSNGPWHHIHERWAKFIFDHLYQYSRISLIRNIFSFVIFL